MPQKQGKKFDPMEPQDERWEVSLCLSPNWRAWPGVDSASCRVLCWSGEMTCTSIAAGCPRLQLLRNISASQEEEFGTRPKVSFEGARAAD